MSGKLFFDLRPGQRAAALGFLKLLVATPVITRRPSVAATPWGLPAAAPPWSWTFSHALSQRD